MNWLHTVFESLSGEPTEVESRGSASRVMFIGVTLLAAAVFSAVFGVAVGSTVGTMALANIVKLPLVVVLSGLFALPTAVLGLRLLGSPIRATDLWQSQATATLATSLVLASTAPLVGLFYHTSAGLGGVLSVTVVFASIGLGLYVFVRALHARTRDGSSRGLIPAVALVVLQMLAVVQLVGLASPILPEDTPFSRGLDGLVSSAEDF